MSVMEQKPARTRRSFTDEFKRDAVAMVLDDGNKIVDVARRLGARSLVPSASGLLDG
jgi:transposase-like protein